ncbi:MAG: fumarate hydratase [bacterium]
MREIQAEQITRTVRDLCIDANYRLGGDVLEAIREARANEESPQARGVLGELEENAQIAARGVFPLCQDTGFAVVFVELGQEVNVVGGSLGEAVQEGVRQGYRDGYLRKSICDPFTRRNTGDNTPAVVHLELVAGAKVRIVVAPKGGGSENMSRVTMLTPAEGWEGVKRFVVQRVREAGPNPCPPIVVGVGVGGTFEKAALIAKKALLRPVGKPHADPGIAEKEQELLREIQATGIGPAGYGGGHTALAVQMEVFPCHIASLPVAVNINCHSARHKEATL